MRKAMFEKTQNQKTKKPLKERKGTKPLTS